MPAPDPDTRAHLEWLGFIQPNGLVVSAPALVKAGAVLNRQDAEGQSRLAACVREREFDPARGPEPCLPDFREFAGAVLGWGFSPRGYAGTEEAPIPAELEVPLPDYGETLRPPLRRPRARPAGRAAAVAASGAGTRPGPGLRRAGNRRRRRAAAGSLAPWPHRAAAPRRRGVRRPALQRHRAPPRLRPRAAKAPAGWTSASRT